MTETGACVVALIRVNFDGKNVAINPTCTLSRQELKQRLCANTETRYSNNVMPWPSIPQQ